MKWAAKYVVIILLALDLCSAAHILGLPLPFRSHSLAMIRLLEEVQAYHGHTFTIVLPDYFINESFVTERNLKYLVARNYSKMGIPDLEREMAHSGFEGGNSWEKIILEDILILCEYLLTDTDLLKELKTQKFDIAVVDNFLNCPCISVLPYKLDVPYIHFGRIIDVIALRLPISLSSTPTYFMYEYSTPMSFKDRVVNVLFYHLMEVIPYSVSVENAVEIYAPEKPYISKQEMKDRSELELIDYDVLLDWPMTLLPKIVHVGGLTTKPARPLTGKLAQFMSKAMKGAVVISFGSLATTMPEHTIAALRGVFQKMKDIFFVVKISGFVFEETNVFSMEWLPQNDLLGHKNCKVFITHCGNRGQFEALYHGVPMIGLPLFGDQPYNARRMKMRGYGLHMDVSKITSTSLVDAIKEIMTNPTYKDKIGKASEIFRNRPQSPAERAAFWVDHTIKFGGKHLRAASLNQPYYQYRLIDVYGFLFLCIAVFSAVLYFLTCSILRCICKTKKTKAD